MSDQIEKKISLLVQRQFPDFIQEEGPVLTQFVKAYYEWMEQEGNALYYNRRILELRDIDTTVTDFLSHFQKKYLYGIPFNVIINKRYLLKHILDVYRSKGSIQCFKLLFRLIYDEDVDVYLPGRDLLRVSDGIWKVPQYLEVSYIDNLQQYVGKKIYGASTKTTAVVESFIRQPVNGTIVNKLYISNIHPKGGTFDRGEKIYNYNDRNSANLALIIGASPIILGSVNSVDVINSGGGFKVGDILRVAHRSLANNAVISTGIGAYVKVTELAVRRGELSFEIIDGGTGYLQNSHCFVYRGDGDTTGNGGSFQLGPLSYTTDLTYDQSLIIDDYLTTVNSDATVNVGSTMSFVTASFGTIATLANTKPGLGYTAAPNIFVRSTLLSSNLAGTVSYNSGSNTVSGTNTIFDIVFAANDCIYLQSNGTNSNTGEYQIIKTVANATSLVLYGPPTNNSTATAIYKAAPNIISSQFALYDPLIATDDGDTPGLNAQISGFPSTGNDAIGKLAAIQSGEGYRNGELVYMYLTGSLTDLQIAQGGSGYSNGDPIVFAGGSPNVIASGYVTTNNTGGVTSAILDPVGSGYQTLPEVRIKTVSGSGAILTVAIQDYNPSSEVIGTIVKKGVGKKRGYFVTTQGFLNSDKVVQDSYFWQDYSYQLRAAITVDKYRNILYQTFHPAGAEMFGQYLSTTTVNNSFAVQYSNTTPTIS
jgi:hypothetical protein